MNTLLDYDDLAVLIEATVRADAMRKLHLSALRADRARGRVYAVIMAAAMMCANAASSLLRYCH